MSAVENLGIDEREYYVERPVLKFRVSQSSAKRLIDIIGSLILLVPAGPLVLILGLCIAADGGLPIYADRRFGRNGDVFRCLKLRTMHRDSDRLLDEYLAQNEAARIEWEADYKLREDPRVTRIGKFLRKSGLDELPQLWNVLRGDMSLVGPRPIPCSHGEEKLYGSYYTRHYQQVRPGLTGIWQIRGGNDVSYRRRVAMAVYYVRHWSIPMDITILTKTAWVVLTARVGY